MSVKKAILEIDGKRYDAHSGEFASKRTRSMDGFVASKNITHLSSPMRPELHNIVTKPTMSDIVRTGENHIGKQVQPSKTLVRSAVKRPQITPVKKIKAQSKVATVPAKRPTHKLTAKLSAANVDHLRAQRALKSPKSHAVAKFTKAKPVTRHHVAVPTPIAHDISPRAHHTTHNKNRTTHDLFEEALAHATSHEQTHHHVKKHRLPRQAGLLVAAFTTVLVGSGYFASQNMDNMKIYLAASKAGFSASLPNYQPSGYHLANVNSDAGVVAANFLSNSDDRSYSITEQPSKWDSQALREMFVAKNSAKYYVVEKNGQTIFIYGDHKATWVSGGVWYQLSGTNSLSDRQLVDLAASL